MSLAEQIAFIRSRVERGRRFMKKHEHDTLASRIEAWTAYTDRYSSVLKSLERLARTEANP